MKLDEFRIVAPRLDPAGGEITIDEVLLNGFELDVVKSADAFVEAASTEPKAASIQPGTYTLRSQMSAAAALELLLDPASRTSERVLVREGLTAAEIAGVLAKASERPLAEYTKALKDAEALGLPKAAGGKAEGWLFPDTYEFDTKATPAEQLAAMVTQMRKVLDELGVSDAKANRVLTEASIVQAEGSRPEDFGKIARVIENRLSAGRMLQMDSTVHYVVGKDKITTTKQQRETKSPYNTYAVKGLPPGPIGLDADGLHAVVLFGGRLFAGAVRVALPAVTALLVVNIGFAAISRAAIRGKAGT